MKNKKKVIGSIISIAVSVLIIAAIYYIQLPPINIFSEDFWGFLVLAAAVISIPLTLVLSLDATWFPGYSGSRPRENKKVNMKLGKKAITAICVSILVPVAVQVGALVTVSEKVCAPLSMISLQTIHSRLWPSAV